MSNSEALQLRNRFYTATYRAAVCDQEPRDIRRELRKLIPDPVNHRRVHIDRSLNPHIVQALNFVKNVGETIADGQRRQLALSPHAVVKVFNLLDFADSSWAGHPWIFFNSRRNYTEEIIHNTYTSLGYGINIKLATYNQGELSGHAVATVSRSDGQVRRRVPGSSRISGRLAA